MVTRLAQTRRAAWVTAIVVGDAVAALVLAASRNWSTSATWAAALIGGALVLAGTALAIWLLVGLFPAMSTAARSLGVLVVVVQGGYAVLVILICGIAVGTSQWNVPF